MEFEIDLDDLKTLYVEYTISPCWMCKNRRNCSPEHYCKAMEYVNEAD